LLISLRLLIEHLSCSIVYFCLSIYLTTSCQVKTCYLFESWSYLYWDSSRFSRLLQKTVIILPSSFYCAMFTSLLTPHFSSLIIHSHLISSKIMYTLGRVVDLNLGSNN
jgi:hypothetical protein